MRHLRNIERRVRHFCGSACCAAILVIGLGAAVPKAVTLNAESLGRVKSYHLRFHGESRFTVKGSVQMPLGRDSEIEIWKDGMRRRELKRVFRLAVGDVVEEQRGNGRVIQISTDDRVARRLEGWDPAHPYALPLNFGRNAVEFGEVRGSFQPVDPRAAPTELEAISLLWHIAPGFAMADAAAIAEIEDVTNPNAAITRVRIVATSNPRLAPFTGTVVDIDSSHGFMISRIERADATKRDVYEALGFREAAEGLWLPTAAQVTSVASDGAVERYAKWEFDIAEVNTPIADEDLTVHFPEGSKVIEGPDLKIHLWGKDGPTDTFTSDEEFRNHIYARAREYQQGTPTGTLDDGKKTEPTRNWSLLVAANIGGIVLIVALTIIRRRLTGPVERRDAGGQTNAGDGR